jgi:hypothetical protein
MIFWQKGIMGRKELTWNSLYNVFDKFSKRGVDVEEK